jgi:hypothetical protein
MRHIILFRWLWILGLILSITALILSGICKILNSSTLAFCGSLVLKPTFGWVGIVGLSLVIPLIAAGRQDSQLRLDKIMAGMGFFLLVVRAIYVALPRVFFSDTLGDFSMYYDGMRFLYLGNNPYSSVDGSVTFPLPAFFLYRLASLGGSLDVRQTYLVWWVINVVAACMLISISYRRMLDRSNKPTNVLVCALFVMLSGIWEAMSHGQTTVLAALGIAIYMLLKFNKQWGLELLGVLTLAFAVLLKPYLGIVIAGGIGIGLIARRWRLVLQMIALSVFILSLIGLSILASGGVDSRTYLEFFDNFRRLGSNTGIANTAFSGGLYGNMSPVAAIVFILGRLGNEQIDNGWVSTVLGLVLIMAISWFLL